MHGVLRDDTQEALVSVSTTELVSSQSVDHDVVSVHTWYFRRLKMSVDHDVVSVHTRDLTARTVIARDRPSVL